MKILVTGGAGFIGTIVVETLLKYGYQVRVLDSLMFGASPVLGFLGNENFEIKFGDIASKDTVKACMHNIDAVVHLAAIVGEPACAKYPELAQRTNVVGTENIVEAAEGRRVLLASTCSNYGKHEGLAEEWQELKPLSLYADTKIVAEQRVLELEDSCVLRFATAFGTSYRMRFDLLLNEFVRDAYVNGEVKIYSPESWRPFVHVRDIAYAVLNILEKSVTGIYNIGGHNCQKRQLAKLVQKYIPFNLEYINSSKPDLRDYQVSFQKFDDLELRVNLTLEDGIVEVLNALHIIDNPMHPIYGNV